MTDHQAQTRERRHVRRSLRFPSSDWWLALLWFSWLGGLTAVFCWYWFGDADVWVSFLLVCVILLVVLPIFFTMYRRAFWLALPWLHVSKEYRTAGRRIACTWTRSAPLIFKPVRDVQGDYWLPGLAKLDLDDSGRLVMWLRLPYGVRFMNADLDSPVRDGVMADTLGVFAVTRGKRSEMLVPFLIVVEDKTQETRHAN